MIAEGATDEEVSIYRQSDHGDFEAARGGRSVSRTVPSGSRGKAVMPSQRREMATTGDHPNS